MTISDRVLAYLHKRIRNRLREYDLLTIKEAHG